MDGWVVQGRRWIRVTNVEMIGPGSATSPEVPAFTPSRDFFQSEISALYEVSHRLGANPLVPKPGDHPAMKAIRKRIAEIEEPFRVKHS